MTAKDIISRDLLKRLTTDPARHLLGTDICFAGHSGPIRQFLIYMGRSRSPDEHPFRFFLNLSDAIATNVFLMLYPKPDVRFLLGENRSRMEELLGCLNSLEQQVLINGGRIYGGGLHKLEPSELANLPMPRLPEWLRTQKQAEPVFS